MRPTSPAAAPPGGRTLGLLLARYRAGEPLACAPVAEGLLNDGYRLRTTSGTYFLKRYLDDPDRPHPRATDPAVIARQHTATARLAALGLPVAAPLAGRGGTVHVLDGAPYALFAWVEGRHRTGPELTGGQAAALGDLLGRVHVALERVLGAGVPGGGHLPGRAGSARAAETEEAIGRLLALVRARRPREAIDALAERRLLERRALLARHGHLRPPRPPAAAGGWVHGDFHPFNVIYRGPEPAAVVDWDRLDVRPRAEEAVRAAVIFFLCPGGALDLGKVARYARAYRAAAGAPAAELAGAVRRVWWERLNDLWILRWRYQHGDPRPDPLFPATSALVPWWTRERAAVLAAFTG